MQKSRDPVHEVDARFVERWSPRAYQDKPVPRHVLESMVEAARWAPSSMNAQPWRFYICDRPGPTRDRWNEAVNEFNRVWGDRVPVLVWVVAKTRTPPTENHPDGRPNRHADFDTGAATMQFVLEGNRHGIRTRYIGGIDPQKAHAILGLGEDQQVVCGMYLGYPGNPADLPERLQAREVPSDRLKPSEIATFAADADT